MNEKKSIALKKSNVDSLICGGAGAYGVRSHEHEQIKSLKISPELSVIKFKNISGTF